jgi:hypothetical protein
MLKAGYRTVKVQGLPCYVPVVKCYDGGKLLWKTDVEAHYPLVNKQDALKYAQIEVLRIYELNQISSKGWFLKC